MIVEDMIDDLKKAIATTPEAEGYEIAVASYVAEPGGQISVMRAGSYHWDESDEFFLVPDGMGSAYKLDERKIDAKTLLCELELNHQIQRFVAFVRDSVSELPDGSIVSLNFPLWGTGISNDARLIYFYFNNVMRNPKRSFLKKLSSWFGF